MRLTLLDTSTVVACIYAAHPQHAWALEQRHRAEAVVLSAHSLAEVYKVVTGHPRIRFTPELALQTVADLAAQSRVIPLTAGDYQAALTRCARLGLSGSVIFDALIAQAALKAEAGAIVTLNPRDFLRLGDDVRALVVSP